MMILQVTDLASKGIDKLFDTYILFGVLGLLVFASLYVSYKLWVKNTTLVEENKKDLKDWYEIRLQETLESRKLLIDTTNLLASFPATVSKEVRNEADRLMTEIDRRVDEIKRLKCKSE